MNANTSAVLLATNSAIVIALADLHLGKGSMQSSALLCVQNAAQMTVIGMHRSAAQNALRSLTYSVGIFHPDHTAAKAIVDAM